MPSNEIARERVPHAMEIKELSSFWETRDWKTILKTRPPCISVYASLPGSPSDEGEFEVRWKAAVKSLESQVTSEMSEASDLIKAISPWQDVSASRPPHARTVAIFRSPEISESIWIQKHLPDMAIVGPHFFIRPLLPESVQRPKFYILTIGKKDIRLLRCESPNLEEISLGHDVPATFDAYMDTVKPDHRRQSRSASGPSSGSSQGVLSGEGIEAEKEGEDVHHFYHVIDRAVNATLREAPGPLVLAGVGYELAIYRAANTYPDLVEEAVVGAPHGLKGVDLYEQALKAIEVRFQGKVDEALHLYTRASPNLIASDVKSTLVAAHDGRIRVLFVSDAESHSTGHLDEGTNEAKLTTKPGPQDEDLVNDAAVQTILHAGQVMVVPSGKIPNGSPIAALLRY